MKFICTNVTEKDVFYVYTFISSESPILQIQMTLRGDWFQKDETYDFSWKKLTNIE